MIRGCNKSFSAGGGYRETVRMGTEINVHNSIRIVGRGVMLLGHVRSGTVRVGQVTEPLVLGHAPVQRLEVSAVERLSSVEGRSPAVGIAFRRPPHLDDLRRALPPGSVLVLEEPAEFPSQST